MTNIIEDFYENLQWSSGVISEFALKEYLKKYVEEYHLYIGKTLDIFLPDTLEKKTICVLSFSTGTKELFKVFDGASVYELSLVDQCFAANFEEEALGILFQNDFDIEKALRNPPHKVRKLWKSDEIANFVELKKIYGGDLMRISKEMNKNNLSSVTLSEIVDFDYQYFFSTDNMTGGNSDVRSPDSESGTGSGSLLSTYHEGRAKRLIEVYRKSERLLNKQKRKSDSVMVIHIDNVSTNSTTNAPVLPLPLLPADTTNITTTTASTTDDNPTSLPGGVGVGVASGGGSSADPSRLRRHRNLISRVDQIKTAYGSGITNLKNLKAYEQIARSNESPNSDTDNEEGDPNPTPTQSSSTTSSRKSKRQKKDTHVMNILSSSHSSLNPKNRIIIGINEILLCKLSRLIELMKESKRYESDNDTVLIGSESKVYSEALIPTTPPAALPVLQQVEESMTTASTAAPHSNVVSCYSTNTKGVVLPTASKIITSYNTLFPVMQQMTQPIAVCSNSSSSSSSSYNRPNVDNRSLVTSDSPLVSFAATTATDTGVGVGVGVGNTCRFSLMNDIQHAQQHQQPLFRAQRIDNSNNSNSSLTTNRYTKHIESFLKAFLATQCNYNELFCSIHEKGSVAIYPPLPNFNAESRSINPSINIIRISQHFSKFLSCFLDSALPPPSTSSTGGEDLYGASNISTENINTHHENNQGESFTIINVNINTCELFHQQQQHQSVQDSSVGGIVAHVEFLWLAQGFTNGTKTGGGGHHIPVFSTEVRGILDCSFKDFYIFDSIIQFDFDSLHRQLKSLKAL